MFILLWQQLELKKTDGPRLLLYTPGKPNTGRMGQRIMDTQFLVSEQYELPGLELSVRVRLAASDKGEQNDGKQSRLTMQRFRCGHKRLSFRV